MPPYPPSAPSPALSCPVLCLPPPSYTSSPIHVPVSQHLGDTRPCGPLIAAGRGATLLIHEATFEADMLSHAQAKNHSTLQEALEVAEKMGAYR